MKQILPFVDIPGRLQRKLQLQRGCRLRRSRACFINLFLTLRFDDSFFSCNSEENIIECLPDWRPRLGLNCVPSIFICWNPKPVPQIIILFENKVIAWASQVAQAVDNLPANAGVARDTGSIPGSGRSPEEGNGNSFQYTCLGNPMDRGTWGLQSMGLQRVGYDWPTSLALSIFQIPTWLETWVSLEKQSLTIPSDPQTSHFTLPWTSVHHVELAYMEGATLETEPNWDKSSSPPLLCFSQMTCKELAIV